MNYENLTVTDVKKMVQDHFQQFYGTEGNKEEIESKLLEELKSFMDLDEQYEVFASRHTLFVFAKYMIPAFSANPIRTNIFSMTPIFQRMEDPGKYSLTRIEYSRPDRFSEVMFKEVPRIRKHDDLQMHITRLKTSIQNHEEQILFEKEQLSAFEAQLSSGICLHKNM